MGIAIKKTHTKFEDLIFKIGKVPAILRFDQFYKGNCLKMAIFFSHFFVLTIKVCSDLHFSGTYIKVKLTAIIGRAITPIMTILAIMGVMGRPIMAIMLTFCWCHMKIWQKCRSPVKTVLKKIHPMEFYG